MRQVLVIGDIEAPRRRRRGARPRGVLSVEVTRATVIDASPLGELEAADAWLARAVGSLRDAVTGEALALLNRAVAGHRLAARDPWVADASAARALAWRVGYGTGEQVADGEWESARELPLPAPRPFSISPQERVAAVLGGRDAVLACEELALRARGDLDHGRVREAALQLVVALEAAMAELGVWRGEADMAERLDELAGRRPAVAAAGRSALQGGLEGEAVAAVEGALGRLEAALRARHVAALSG